MEQPGILAKLTKRPITRNALVEINNTIATAGNVLEVSRSHIQGILTKYGVDSLEVFSADLENIYKLFMAHWLTDFNFTDDEVESMWHLKELLNVSDDMHNTIFLDLGSTIFSRESEKAYSDLQLSQEEKEHLDRIATVLELPDNVKDQVLHKNQQISDKKKRDKYYKALDSALVDLILTDQERTRLSELTIELELTDRDIQDMHTRKHNELLERKLSAFRSAIKRALFDSDLTDTERKEISNLATSLELTREQIEVQFRSSVQEHIQKLIDDYTTSGMISPDDENKLNSFARQYDINIVFAPEDQQALNKLRRMWQIREGTPPVVDTPISLHNSERCYFKTDINWHEMRKEKVALAYTGPTARIRIAKGIYWRAGVLGGKPITSDTLVKIDSGTVYVTNKRLLFVGKLKNTSIRLNKIIDVEMYSDGVIVQKDAGRSPFLEFTQERDIFCATLQRAISDS